MTRYLCCCCDRAFAGEQIVDDFERGVKRGFLCPHCGQNIEDTPCGEGIAYASPGAERYARWLLGLLLAETLLLHGLDLWDAELAGIRLLWLVLLLDLPVFLYGLLRYPRDMLWPVLKTRRVPPPN